jgi:hypothetical protein
MHLGLVGDIKSETWATSSRKGGRHPPEPATNVMLPALLAETAVVPLAITLPLAPIRLVKVVVHIRPRSR